MSARTSALRIVLGFLLAPVGAIALWYLLAIAWRMSSGELLDLTVADALEGIMFIALVGTPIAYAVEAILLLAFGVLPPPGWRGLATTVVIGMVSGALTLGGLLRFGPATVAGVASVGGVGAAIGGSAACFYALIVEGVPRAKPAV